MKHHETCDDCDGVYISLSIYRGFLRVPPQWYVPPGSNGLFAPFIRVERGYEWLCTPLSIKNCGRRLVSWLGLSIKVGYPQTPWFRKSVFPIKCSDTLTCARLTSSDCSVCLAIHFGSTAISSCARCRHGAWMVHEQRTTPVVSNSL